MQESAHDFAAAGLGQGIGKADFIRFGDGANGLGDVLFERIDEAIAGLAIGAQGYKGDDGLTLEVVWFADNRRFNPASWPTRALSNSMVPKR